MKTVNNSKSDEPPSKPTQLEQIILNEFVDSRFVIETVRKHTFETTLFPALSKISVYIESKNYNPIPSVVGTLLTTINDNIQKATGKEKEILEYLSGELFTQQIALLNSTEQGRQCWEKCIPVLQHTCDFKNYNFEELSKFLKFDSIDPAKNTKNQNKCLPYYMWCGTEMAFDEMIRDIKNKQWISNVIEFKKLFKVISDPNYTFQAPSKNLDKLVVLFSELNARKLIALKKQRGHFYPLSLYGLDFEEKLFKKEPKKHLEAIKRNKGYYDRILMEVTKLIDSNCGEIVDLE